MKALHGSSSLLCKIMLMLKIAGLAVLLLHLFANLCDGLPQSLVESVARGEGSPIESADGDRSGAGPAPGSEDLQPKLNSRRLSSLRPKSISHSSAVEVPRSGSLQRRSLPKLDDVERSQRQVLARAEVPEGIFLSFERLAMRMTRQPDNILALTAVHDGEAQAFENWASSLNRTALGDALVAVTSSAAVFREVAGSWNSHLVLLAAPGEGGPSSPRLPPLLWFLPFLLNRLVAANITVVYSRPTSVWLASPVLLLAPPQGRPPSSVILRLVDAPASDPLPSTLPAISPSILLHPTRHDVVGAASSLFLALSPSPFSSRLLSDWTRRMSSLPPDSSKSLSLAPLLNRALAATWQLDGGGAGGNGGKAVAVLPEWACPASSQAFRGPQVPLPPLLRRAALLLDFSHVPPAQQRAALRSEGLWWAEQGGGGGPQGEPADMAQRSWGSEGGGSGPPSSDGGGAEPAAAASGGGQGSFRGVPLPPAWVLPESVLSLYPNSGSMWRPYAEAHGGMWIDARKFKLVVHVITFDRVESLHRCLRSLAQADYGGDNVALRVTVDNPYGRFKAWTGTKEFKYSAADEARLLAMQGLLESLANFTWPFGEFTVTSRWSNAGMQGQWLESLYPMSPNEFGMTLEDDMEMSPFYYAYLKKVLLHYYFDQLNYDPRIYGLSFQRQWLVPGPEPHPSVRAEPNVPFLYTLVGIWGQVFFPLPWRDFRRWWDFRRHNESRRPELRGIICSNWHIGQNERIWDGWIVEWPYVHAMWNMYIFLPGEFTMATNWREAGLDFGKTEGPDSKLLRRLSDEDGTRQWWEALPAFPPTSELKRYDYCFEEEQQQQPAEGEAAFKALLQQVAQHDHVTLVLVTPNHPSFPINWACVGRGFYSALHSILLVPAEEAYLAGWLAAKGHAVHLLPPRAAGTEKGAPASRPLLSPYSPSSDSSAAPPPAGSPNQSVFGEESPRLAHLLQQHARAVLWALSADVEVLVAGADTVLGGDAAAKAAALMPADADMAGIMDESNFASSVWFVRNKQRAVEAWEDLERTWRQVEEEMQGPDSASTLLDHVSKLWKKEEVRERKSMADVGREWLKRRIESGLKWSHHLRLQQSPAAAQGAEADGVPLAGPLSLRTAAERMAWLQGLKLWWAQDHDWGCQEQVCKRV